MTDTMTHDDGRSGSDEPSGRQPSASAADASSQSGIPNAGFLALTLYCDWDASKKGAPLYVRPEAVCSIQYHDYVTTFSGDDYDVSLISLDNGHSHAVRGAPDDILGAVASGMSAEGQDAERLGAEPASPVREAETPNG